MPDLYPHQDRFVADIRAALRQYDSVLGQAPTGFGKTVIAAAMAKSATERGNRSLFLVHRRELVKQTFSTFQSFGIPTGVLAAGWEPDLTATVQIGLIPSMPRRLDLARPRVVFVDEAHLSAAKTWTITVDHYRAAGAKIVGLSATPERLDGKPLDRFQKLIGGPSVRWLIDNNFLSDYRAFAPTLPDLTGVPKRGGDFATGALSAVMATDKIVGDAVTHWRKYARDLRTIGFCVDRDHAGQMAEAFRTAGIPAAPITGAMNDDERRNLIAALADGDLRVLFSVALCSEGFDLSAQIGREVPVEAAIMLRPTQSLALHRQQCGRALRRKPNPAIILDHAGNALRHGLPDDDHDWTLDGRAKRASTNDGTAPLKRCGDCFRVQPAANRQCEQCGVPFPVNTRALENVEGDLIELKRREKQAKEDASRQRRLEESQAKTLDDLVRLGRSRGYRYPEQWAAHRFSARMRRAG